MRKLIINEEKLRVQMAHAGIYSLAELSRKANVHYNTVYSLTEMGDFKSSTVERIAAALGCDPLDLLSTIDLANGQQQASVPSATGTI